MKLLAGLLALATWAAWGLAMGQAPAPVKAPGPEMHQHDLARLRIALEGNLLSLWLLAPLDGLVGFETAPRTARQRQAVKDLAARLHQPQTIFVPPAAAQCVPAHVALASEVIDSSLLAAPSAPAGPASSAASSAAPSVPPAAGAASPSPAAAQVPAEVPPATEPSRRRTAARTPSRSHADLEATISFRCGKPQSLSGLQVRMFDAFPTLSRIDVDIVTPRGQSGARLSPNRTNLTW